jgi:frataxin
MTEGEFHRLADKTLDHLQERLEAYVEDQDVPDGDVEYGMGVLTVRLGRLGTYVINKQTPNRQIWMSSPVSGPVRYDYDDGRWVYR